jgi:hypothetical protein
MLFGRNIGKTAYLPWPPWVTHNTDKIISVCGVASPKVAKASTVVTVLCRWCWHYHPKLRQWKYGLKDGGGLPLELLTFYAKNAFVEFTHLFILIDTSYLTWQGSQHRTRSRTTLETRFEHFKAAWTLLNVPRVLLFGKSQMGINLENS